MIEQQLSARYWSSTVQKLLLLCQKKMTVLPENQWTTQKYSCQVGDFLFGITFLLGLALWSFGTDVRNFFIRLFKMKDETFCLSVCLFECLTICKKLWLLVISYGSYGNWLSWITKYKNAFTQFFAICHKERTSIVQVYGNLLNKKVCNETCTKKIFPYNSQQEIVKLPFYRKTYPIFYLK